ncbi:MAG: ATP-binding protein [Planctomycetota bacterium]
MTSTTTGQRARSAVARAPVRVGRSLAAIGAVALAAAAALALPAPIALTVLVGLVAALAWPLAAARPASAAPPIAASASAAAEQRRGDAVRQLGLELAIDRLRSVLESLREGVIVVDGAGEVVLANPVARHALREPGTAPVGRCLWDVLAPELATAARNAFAALGADGHGRDVPERQEGIPFGSRVLDLTAVRVRSQESGQDFGTVFLFVDATRNHELAHLKDRFLSSISHELRTPLTNICAYSEILRHLLPGETAEWPEFVRIVHDEALQLNRLVDAVFDYSQLESGQVAFQVQPADAGIIVQDSCQRALDRAATKGVQLQVQIDSHLPLVVVDVGRFAHVCDHLLDNAIKFTPRDGAVRVSVRQENGGICLRVDDSGPGIARSERDAVFEMFRQLSDHLTDKPAGAGIGLATSRAIVQRLGGAIRVDQSELGGAAFVVTLPPAPVPSAAADGDPRVGP